MNPAMLALLNCPSLVQLSVLATTTDPVSVLVNYGAIGILLIMFATGRVYSFKTVDRLELRVAEQDRQLEIMMRVLANAALPALRDGTEALRMEAGLAGELREAISEIRNLGDG